MKKASKRYKKLIESVKDKKIDTIDAIIGTLKNNANAKFLESIDLSFKINLKKIKTADSSLRSVIELPHGNGKKIKIAVLCDENKGCRDAKFTCLEGSSCELQSGDAFCELTLPANWDVRLLCRFFVNT